MYSGRHAGPSSAQEVDDPREAIFKYSPTPVKAVNNWVGTKNAVLSPRFRSSNKTTGIALHHRRQP